MNPSDNFITALKQIVKKGKLDKALLSKLSLEEQQLANNLYEDGSINDVLDHIGQVDLNNKWEQFKEELPHSDEFDIRTRQDNWRPRLRYAAALAALFALASFIYYSLNLNSESVLIEPVKDAITLKLDNGTSKVIDIAKKNGIVLQNEHVVGSQKDQMIYYNSKKSVRELIYNELHVPFGKTFGVTLSDGTSVYLNSGTKLRYPISFVEGANREVFVDGEAYFEVAKDSLHPFIVNTDNIGVEVLGTKFNVSSFREDQHVSTVLVEGSVKMYAKDVNDQQFVLVPRQKGTWDRNENKISLEKVDTNLYTGWLDGELVFRDASFDNMAKKLERSYNVQIENNNEILRQKKFDAAFNVNIENIVEVLGIIQKIHPFEYTISDNKIELN